jgi:molybdopterin-containing oxidoreductase family membrane subunit
MEEYQQVDQAVYQALRPPGRAYKCAVVFLALGVLGLLGAWVYQIRTGMGVAGVSFPVGWGVYIGSFVFWIGIAHSGTLISAILLLVRSRWRTAISRSAEAMTVVAIAVAGMFPLVHLGASGCFSHPPCPQRQILAQLHGPAALRSDRDHPTSLSV